MIPAHTLWMGKQAVLEGQLTRHKTQAHTVSIMKHLGTGPPSGEERDKEGWKGGTCSVGLPIRRSPIAMVEGRLAQKAPTNKLPRQPAMGITRRQRDYSEALGFCSLLPGQSVCLWACLPQEAVVQDSAASISSLCFMSNTKDEPLRAVWERVHVTLHSNT